MHAVSCYLAHSLACGWVHKLTEICGLVPKHYLELWFMNLLKSLHSVQCLFEITFLFTSEYFFLFTRLL